jgi:hypothetical protein
MYFGKMGTFFLKELQDSFVKELKLVVFEELKAITPEIGGQPKEIQND